MRGVGGQKIYHSRSCECKTRACTNRDRVDDSKGYVWTRAQQRKINASTIVRSLISPQQIPRKWLVTIFTRFRDRMDFYGGARRWSCGVQAWNIGREPIRRAPLWNIHGRMLWKSVVLNELGLYIYVLPRERADLSPFLFPRRSSSCFFDRPPSACSPVRSGARRTRAYTLLVQEF